jgi:hypothetical protein
MNDPVLGIDACTGFQPCIECAYAQSHWFELGGPECRRSYDSFLALVPERRADLAQLI